MLRPKKDTSHLQDTRYRKIISKIKQQNSTHDINTARLDANPHLSPELSRKLADYSHSTSMIDDSYPKDLTQESTGS
jgi:hypothetical protein